MSTTQIIRYAGEDIPVDLYLSNDDGTPIDPTTLQKISVYLVDKDSAILQKYQEPEAEGYEPITVDEDKARFWMQSDFTKDNIGKRIMIEASIEEEAPELDDEKQNTIVISEHILIKDTQIKAES